MSWIFDNLQVVVIALVVLGSLVKNVLESRGQKKQEYGTPEDDDDRPFVPIDEDKSYRKILSPSMPPPLERHVAPPPLPSPADEARAREAAVALKHQTDLAERLRQIRETKATTTGGAAATRARLAGKGTSKPSQQGPVSIIAKRLRDPAEVRRAFVMREILDPPIGLR